MFSRPCIRRSGPQQNGGRPIDDEPERQLSAEGRGKSSIWGSRAFYACNREGRTHENPPPGLLRARRCRRFRSFAVGLAAARPDQAKGLAAFVVEQVGVDRRVEARIVELDREIIAALGGALRPRGADLGAADKHPVARRVVASPIGLGDDADALGLDAQGDDFPRSSLPDFLKVPMVAISFSPWLFEPATIAASMAIDRPQAIDDAPACGPEPSGGWRR